MTPPLVDRTAGAPISWGVCEVPGWGLQLPPDRVLGEMGALGLTATELGPDDYLPSAPDDLRDLLTHHGLLWRNQPLHVIQGSEALTVIDDSTAPLMAGWICQVRSSTGASRENSRRIVSRSIAIKRSPANRSESEAIRS
jgi:inosose dehydratase